jgi:hypothetical protein
LPLLCRMLEELCIRAAVEFDPGIRAVEF